MEIKFECKECEERFYSFEGAYRHVTKTGHEMRPLSDDPVYIERLEERRKYTLRSLAAKGAKVNAKTIHDSDNGEGQEIQS
jgi:hypothetical protein